MGTCTCLAITCVNTHPTYMYTCIPVYYVAMYSLYPYHIIIYNTHTITHRYIYRYIYIRTQWLSSHLALIGLPVVTPPPPPSSFSPVFPTLTAVTRLGCSGLRFLWCVCQPGSCYVCKFSQDTVCINVYMCVCVCVWVILQRVYITIEPHLSHDSTH